MDQDENPADTMRPVQKQACPRPEVAPRNPRQWRSIEYWVACSVLALTTLTAFWPVLHAGFINLDDREYVLENPHVATGLKPANIVWAFTTGYSSNWHPLTWISHMLDVQMFGLKAQGPHAVNLLLHIANSIILFLLLSRLTKTNWRSLAVAGLFALHPLHVESVAWVAERKDVLSTLFFLLTLWAYEAYVLAKDKPATGAIIQNQPVGTRAPYALALFLFALGLMSKPMLVTLPFVLLLLDYWPLERRPRNAPNASAWLPLLKEKIPFVLVAGASCVITFAVQNQAKAVKVFLPLSLRLENAVVSYLSYISKTLWPTRLCVFYPHPNTRYHLTQIDLAHPPSEQWSFLAIFIAGVALVAISWCAWNWRKRLPWVFTGWFWYLGTLVPVIGIIQVGMQAMADRYTYIPLIGLFIGVVWSAALCSARRPRVQPALLGLTAALWVACGLVTHLQAGYWRDDMTLFEHAWSVTTNNAVAECHVGAGLANQGQFDPAERRFKAALIDDPFFYFAHLSLGSLYEAEGHANEAVQEYLSTLKLRPWDEFARVHLAGLFHKLGRDDQALDEYKKNLQSNPDSVEGNYQLGALLLDRGDLKAAGLYLNRTVDLKPDHVDALLCLADLHTREGKLAAAEEALKMIVQLYPTNAELRINLASLLWLDGQQSQALKEYAEAVRLRPNEPIGHYDLAVAWAGTGNALEAMKQLETALQLKPDYPEALSELAWLLATNPRPDLRNGQRAVSLARRALDLGAGDQPRTWAALDVAYAETGQFSEAFGAAQKAKDLASRRGDTTLAQSAQERLLLYQANKPFHLP